MIWGYLHFRKPPYMYIYICTMIYMGNHGYEWSHWVPNWMVNTPNGQPVFEPIDLTVFDPSSDCWLGICQFFKWSFHNIHIFVRRQSCLCKWVRCSFVVIGSLFLVGWMYVYIYIHIHTYIHRSLILLLTKSLQPSSFFFKSARFSPKFGGKTHGFPSQTVP